MKRTFCFDFDGTFADTLPLVIGTANRLFKKASGEEISDEFLRKIREDGIEDVFREAKIPLYRLFLLYFKIKKEMNSGVKDVEINEGMREVVKNLKKKGARVGILTSNSEENVIAFLKDKDFEYFDFVKTAGLLGKEREIRRLKEKGREFFYIGDETRDVKAGRRAGVKTIAVSWGLSSKKALQKAKPDFLVERPEDLLDLS